MMVVIKVFTTPDFFSFFKSLLMWFAWAILSVAVLPARLAAVSSNLTAINVFRMRRIAYAVMWTFRRFALFYT